MRELGGAWANLAGYRERVSHCKEASQRGFWSRAGPGRREQTPRVKEENGSHLYRMYVVKGRGPVPNPTGLPPRQAPQAPLHVAGQAGGTEEGTRRQQQSKGSKIQTSPPSHLRTQE